MNNFTAYSGNTLKKIVSIFISAVLLVCLCSCKGNNEDDVYELFKSYISQNGIEEDYYIQISKTANAENTLVEASKMGDDCAFMEYDVSGLLKFYRSGSLTEISALTYFAPDKTDAKWEDFEFASLNEKYRSILNNLLEGDKKKTIETSKTEDKEYPESVKIKYDVKELDTKSIFSSGGNFGSVTVKFDTDKTCSKFKNVTVSCQYDYNDIIYIYAVTFGKPADPDENGKDGHRPEDIEKIFENYSQK